MGGLLWEAYYGRLTMGGLLWEAYYARLTMGGLLRVVRDARRRAAAAGWIASYAEYTNTMHIPWIHVAQPVSHLLGDGMRLLDDAQLDALMRMFARHDVDLDGTPIP